MLFGLAVLGTCLCQPLLYAESAVAPISADAVKAAYLINFIRFTEWQSRGPNADAPFIIGIAGNRELEDYLWKITEGKLLQGHKIRVRRLTAPADASDCQLIYIHTSPHTEASPFAAIDWLHAVRGAPVLTVAQEDGFLQNGGMINFYAENNNLRFEIAPQSAEKVGLRLSSRLLSIARIVNVVAPPDTSSATP